MTQRPDRVVLEYTPDDFYYLADAANLPPQGQCDVMFDSLSPYQQQMCLNAQQVTSILSDQEIHEANKQKIFDLQSKYYTEVLKSFNLGIGILAIISFLYYSTAVVVVAPPSPP